MKFKKIVKEGSEMHPEITCDRCGFTSRQEDYFDIEGDEILCYRCRRGIASEAMKKRGRRHSNDAAKGWFGIKDAKFIYHGDWNDPEVEYKGVSLNYWDVESGLLEIYRDEHPEDRNDKGFDKWMAAHPEEIRSQLELLYDAEMEYRADNPEEQYNEDWASDMMSDDLGDDERFPVMTHGDAITELEDKIENAWVSLEAHSADVDRIMELVQNYIKLYELEPERAKSMLGA